MMKSNVVYKVPLRSFRSSSIRLPLGGSDSKSLELFCGGQALRFLRQKNTGTALSVAAPVMHSKPWADALWNRV